MYSPAIERALALSLQAHAGQLRKATEPVPYVVHPLHVALILARWGQEEDVIVAGLLHDVVEDCEGWNLAQIEAEFGRHVAHMVGELTEDKSKGWEERKRHGVEHVPHMSPQSATVKAADKLHNLQTLAAELRHCANSEAVWIKFRRGRERTLAMSAELVEALSLRVEAKVAKALRTALKAVHDADAASQQRAATAAR